MNKKAMLGTLVVAAIAIGAFMFFSGMTSTTDYLSEIESLMAEGAYEEALNLVDRFTPNDSEYIQAQLKRAKIELAQGKDPSQTLDEILSLDGGNIEALSQKAVYLKNTETKEAYYAFLLDAYEKTKDSSFIEKLDALKPVPPTLDKASGTYDQKVSLTVTNFNENDQFFYSVNGGPFKHLRKDTLSYIKDSEVTLYTENDLGLKSDAIIYEYIIETFKKNLDLGLEAKESGDLVNATTYLEKALTYAEDSKVVLDALIDIYTDLGEKNNLIRILDLADYHLKDAKYGDILETLIPNNPILSLEDGFYSGNKTISLLETEDRVYYTIDGSRPSVNSSLWQGDLNLEQGYHNIKLVAVNTEGIRSDIVDYAYEIDMPERDLYVVYSQADGSSILTKRHLYEPAENAMEILAFEPSLRLTKVNLSDDGTLMAASFLVYDSDNKATGSEIYLIDPETYQMEKIFELDNTFVKRLSFADNKTLIFDHGSIGVDIGDAEVYSMNLETKAITNLTNNDRWDSFAMVSGDKIIYTHRAELNWSYSSEIMMMDLDGSNVVNLINDANPETVASMDLYPVPNKDNSKIAFTTYRFYAVDTGFTRQMAILDMNDGKITELLDYRGNFIGVDWVDNDTLIVREYLEDKSTRLLLVEMDGSITVLETSSYENGVLSAYVYK